MRVIKFRVWCEGKMEMAGAIDWADGLPITCNTKTRKLYQDDDHFTLMQYTGLKDVNGKEIYEGDILKWNDEKDNGFSTTGGDNTAAIVYQSCEYMLGDYESLASVTRYHAVEVIGNIYEK